MRRDNVSSLAQQPMRTRQTQRPRRPLVELTVICPDKSTSRWSAAARLTGSRRMTQRNRHCRRPGLASREFSRLHLNPSCGAGAMDALQPGHAGLDLHAETVVRQPGSKDAPPAEAENGPAHAAVRRPDFDRVIHELAAHQHGAVARTQLLQAGVSPDAVVQRLGTGRLRRLRRGVYHVGPLVLPFTREMAAVLACGEDAAVSHRSAAVLWRALPRRATDEPVEIAVTRGRASTPPAPSPSTRVCGRVFASITSTPSGRMSSRRSRESPLPRQPESWSISPARPRIGTSSGPWPSFWPSSSSSSRACESFSIGTAVGRAPAGSGHCSKVMTEWHTPARKPSAFSFSSSAGPGRGSSRQRPRRRVRGRLSVAGPTAGRRSGWKGVSLLAQSLRGRSPPRRSIARSGPAGDARHMAPDRHRARGAAGTPRTGAAPAAPILMAHTLRA